MTNTPTAEEILAQEAAKFQLPLTPEALQLLVINVANTHATNHVVAALEAASEKAEVEPDYYDEGAYYVNKRTIRNAYPLNKII